MMMMKRRTVTVGMNCSVSSSRGAATVSDSISFEISFEI